MMRKLREQRGKNKENKRNNQKCNALFLFEETADTEEEEEEEEQERRLPPSEKVGKAKEKEERR